MLRIFLDANVLVSVLNKEYPLFTYSSRILSLASQPKFEVYSSPLCLAIAFYFAEKKINLNQPSRKSICFVSTLRLLKILSKGVSKTLLNKSIHNFEDGLEYYAAKFAECKCIITEDVEDFYFSDIEVLNCKEFFKRHLIN